MNGLDYLVMLVAVLGIAAYGVWRTRGRTNLSGYLKGRGDAGWLVVGLSVMATQASAITFLSTPGQGYQSGLGFVQNYFGAPLALIVVSAVFLPIYRRLNVYTAYEYLGRRFDAKTRLLGAGLFLLQRGLGAGITIYAPAIVLSTVFGWNLNATIVASSAVAIAYTVAGGSDAVTHTQKYQLAVIFAGMAAAFAILLHKLTATHSVADVLAVAGRAGRLRAVDYSLRPGRRYTLWSGLLGGGFLALSYFGTDQSQVQRYIGASSLRVSRLGLMFNAVCKIPMQAFILLLGVLLFAFYQTHDAPVLFNRTAWDAAVAHDPSLRPVERQLADAHAATQGRLDAWLRSRSTADGPSLNAAVNAAADRESRARAPLAAVAARANDADYVFIRFILDELPHGLIGLLVAAFFAAALSSKAAELNALASTTVVDVYRHLGPGLKRPGTEPPSRRLRYSEDPDRSSSDPALRGTSDAASDDARSTDAHLVFASKAFTIFWGLVAMVFALTATLAENLIQAVNIIGSIFYGVVLGLFLIAFFLARVGGTAAFWAAVLAQATVVGMYLTLDVGYLWYNVIGCGLCVGLAAGLQWLMGPPPRPPAGFEVVPVP